MGVIKLYQVRNMRVIFKGRKRLQELLMSGVVQGKGILQVTESFFSLAMQQHVAADAVEYFREIGVFFTSFNGCQDAFIHPILGDQ